MDNTDNKPKKLGLKLKGSVDTKDLAKDYISSQSSPREEKIAAFEKPDFLNKIRGDTNLTSSEVSKRIDVLKKATQEKDIERERKAAVKDEVLEIHIEKVAASDSQDLPPSSEVLTEVPIDENSLVQKKIQDKPVEKVLEKPAGVKISSDFDDAQAKPVTKLKTDAPKKLKKHDIYNLLDDESSGGFGRRRHGKNKHKKYHTNEKVIREVEIHGEIAVAELASKMSERAVDLIKELMKLGVMADGNKLLDVETAELLVTTFGHQFKLIEEVTVNSMLAGEVDDPKLLRPRPPVVTVMGHVDHGKTSLLDAIRSTDIALKEFGGITQNIGAYQVKLSNGQKITFIDTPGHEAFTAMRSRGTQITDIVVLVVAADDGINNQTIEAINHAKAANLPIIVAVNKIDKLDDYSGALTRIKNEMLMHNLIAEDMGGDVMFVPVSALKKMNLDKLEEAIMLLADLMELKASYDSSASGAVLDSKLDKHKGALTTLLVTRGVLKCGDFIVAGSAYGKVRQIQDDKGANIEIANPSSPVSIFGLDEVAHAGDKFIVMPSERQAREMAESYRGKFREQNLNTSIAIENLIDPFSRGLKKELLLLIKADSQGSLEAIAGSLSKIVHEEVKLKILHKAVGGINESDVSLASASKAMILAFNVRSSTQASNLAHREGVSLSYYSIIYDLINDVKSILSGMLAPNIREVYLGNVEIRQVFNITKVGKVAGCYVTKGMAKRGASMRLIRDDVVIHEGKLKTLKRFKEDVKEVTESYECGIVFENYEDIKVGDQVEIFEYIEEKKADL